jgi:hypothetical protein
MNLDLNDLAEQLMFGMISNGDQLNRMIDGQWEFRKDKGVDDVNSAIRKGLKLGAGKTENEIDGVALYLKDAFKKVKK